MIGLDVDNGGSNGVGFVENVGLGVNIGECEVMVEGIFVCFYVYWWNFGWWGGGIWILGWVI